MHTVLTHLAAVLVGLILYKLFFTKATTFVNSEVAAITSKIEAIKSNDITTYNRIAQEWYVLLKSKKIDLSKVSTELASIINKVL